ncbi:MAG: hypothetical protein R3D33_01040 [Hyphomicrobiaceae bacterium]
MSQDTHADHPHTTARDEAAGSTSFLVHFLETIVLWPLFTALPSNGK